LGFSSFSLSFARRDCRKDEVHTSGPSSDYICGLLCLSNTLIMLIFCKLHEDYGILTKTHVLNSLAKRSVARRCLWESRFDLRASHLRAVFSRFTATSGQALWRLFRQPHPWSTARGRHSWAPAGSGSSCNQQKRAAAT